ncbi:exonuclease subunit SbcD [bacterium]|nr:exonuclease subunit SbcD [bacterium]
MIQFIHTADIHFGMENYGRIDPVTGIHSRLLDFEKSLTTCINYAIDKNVDLFVFAGDAYKTAHPSPTQQKLLVSCFLKLYKAGIPTVIVVGNHDNPLSFGKATALDIFANLPVDGFYVFAKPELKIIPTKNGPVQIIGMPWPNRHQLSLSGAYHVKNAQDITTQISTALSTKIQNLVQELHPTIPSILVGHLTVSSGVFSGSEKRAVYGHDPVLLPSQLALSPLNYVALGHLHRFQELNPNGSIPIVYSGSIDRIDFGERKEEKGFCHVTISDDLQTKYEFIQIATRPFIQIDIILEEDKNFTEQIMSEIKKHTITDAIIKITYKLPIGAQDSVDIKKIQIFCANAWYIVGIFPIRTLEPKQHRTYLNTDMDLKTLLKKYFDDKPSTQKRSSELLEKTMNLVVQKEQDELQVPAE